MIYGQRVILRALEETDLDNCMGWVNDPEVTRYLSTFVWPVSRAFEQAFLQQAVRQGDPHNRILAIVTRDGIYLGNCGLHRIDYRNGTAELGMVIGNKQYWGQGYGADVLLTLMGFAFRQLGLRKLTLRVFQGNQRAMNLYTRCGFVVEGVLKEQHLIDGLYHDEIHMACFARDFRGTQA
ncbi:MAG: GNAT family protein [Bacillota bacterium]